MMLTDTLPFDTPLKNVPDDFFFTTEPLTQRLDLLRHLIESSGFFLILSGEQGVGKKTLLKQLLSSTDPRWEVCRISAPEPSAELGTPPDPELIERLLEEYNLTHSGHDSGSRKDVLFDHIGALHNSGGVPLIIVDDNEALSPDDVGFLAELSFADDTLGARIILICKTERLRRIREQVAAAGHGKITHTVDVPPLEEEQVGDYLHLRWNQTDPVGDNPFTDAVIRSIYHASKGLPANVNRLAEQFLQNRRPHRQPAPNRTPGAWVIEAIARRKGLAAALGGLAFIAVFLLLTVGGDEPAKTPETIVLPAPVPRADTSPAMDSGPAIFEPPPLPSALSTPQVLDGPDEPFQSTIRPPPSEMRGRITASAPAAAPVEDPATTPSMEQTTAPAVATPIKTLPMTASRELDSHRRDARGQPSSPAADKPPKHRAAQQRPKLARNPESLQKHAAPRTIAWLRRQNPGHYTIQLIGLSTKERATGFIERHGIASKAAWFKTVNKDKDWFVVVHGIYPTHKAAGEAIRTLPRTLRESKPWPIRVGKILTRTGATR